MALLPARNILDGTALPVTSQMKTALGSLRDYCSDLLGTDSSNKAAARATLGAAASGANTDITSIAGNAATASGAAAGYFTASSASPRIELHKSGVVAGQWTIDGANNFVFESSNGSGVGSTDLLTLTQAGALSTAGGFLGNAASATTDSQHFCVGQTLTALTGSRAFGTTYTNSTGKPIFVIVNSTSAQGINYNITASINGVGFAIAGGHSASGAQYHCLSFPVPNGATYSVAVSGSGSLSSWSEIR